MQINYRIATLSVLALLVLACNSSKNTVQSAPPEEMEFRMLDTMMVSAPRDLDITDTIIEPVYELPVYRASQKRDHDLLHTQLRLKFDWEKEQVIGEAELKLAPYFYPSSTVVLDAKGFTFSEVRMKGATKDLDYEYDGQQLTIDLGKTFTQDETYTLTISYVATPSASGGSAAITSDKGLFFIDPRNEDPNKPTQIWTQGETEHNSRWFPTIDKPNERTTQEMYVTVEGKYEVLSNGILVSEKKNGDGTKTWHWKMDKPHAPYLFMLAVGEFALVEESWEGKPVTYYVEPEYEDDAKAIFSNTKEMLTFFSDQLGVKYPWSKYAQVVVRDYVSGAMENTTAVIFGEFVQRHKRELIDDNNERIVAHELIHHWFGDLVTTESWANLTMNEGFANYGEYLWFEHKYGRDVADYHLLGEWAGYLSSAQGNVHPLIHFGYQDKEDMFDAHSYNKGGAVLHMLRNYVGDEAFWAGLELYLTENAYTAVEAHNLRLAFEEVTGEDLNWFFNQWYFEQGHPKLDISTTYDPESQVVSLTVEQVQDPELMPAIFQLPVAVDLYLAEDGKAERHNIWIDQRKQTFNFKVGSSPYLINFDADRVLLAEMDYKKEESELVFQYQNAPRFLDRYEAITELRQYNTPASNQLLETALKDNFWNIRATALRSLPAEVGAPTLEYIAEMAASDPRSDVRASAYQQLTDVNYKGAVEAARQSIEKDSAYNVIGSALQYLAVHEPEAALEQAKKLEGERAPDLLMAVGELYATTGDIKYLPFFEMNMDNIDGYAAIYFAEGYTALAMQGSLETIEQAGQQLHQLAINQSTTPWVRFGATRALNQMRQQFGASEEEAEQALANDFMSLLKEIVAKEQSPQLQSFYNQMLPDVEP